MNDDQFDFEEGYQYEVDMQVHEALEDGVNDYYEHVSKFIESEFTCNHFDCTHGDWSVIDRIMHHGCELNQGFDIFGNPHSDILYNCDICFDHFNEGIIPCKRKPTIDRTRASQMLYRYLNNSKAHPLASDIEVQLGKFHHKRFMNGYVLEEVTAMAMHPSRLQKQLEQCDDIEAFFDANGC
jgi:hypothetical protein